MAHAKFYYPSNNSPFKHLSDSNILDFIARYENGESLKTILSDAEGLVSSTFYKNMPYLISDEKCEVCQALIYIKAPSRTFNNSTKKYCTNCKHNYKENCECDACFSIQEKMLTSSKAEHKRQGEAWLKSFQFPALNPDEISIKDKIKLLLLYKYCKKEKKLIEIIKTNDNSYSAFSDELPFYILDLLPKRLLLPYTYSDYEYTFKNEDTSEYEFRHSIVNEPFKINIDIKASLEYFFNSFQKQSFTQIEKLHLWKEVYHFEIKEYLKTQNEKYLYGSLDIHFIDVCLNELVEYFSLAKAFTLIYLTSIECFKIYRNSPQLRKEINTHFLNILETKIHKYKNDINLKDSSSPLNFNFNLLNQYIINHVLRINGPYFNLSTELILKANTSFINN